MSYEGIRDVLDLNEMGARGRRAARALALAPTDRKNAALSIARLG